MGKRLFAVLLYLQAQVVCMGVWVRKVGRRIPMSCSSFSGTRNDLLPEIHEMLSCSGKDDKSLLSPCAPRYN